MSASKVLGTTRDVVYTWAHFIVTASCHEDVMIPFYRWGHWGLREGWWPPKGHIEAPLSNLRALSTSRTTLRAHPRLLSVYYIVVTLFLVSSCLPMIFIFFLSPLLYKLILYIKLYILYKFSLPCRSGLVYLEILSQYSDGLG